MYKFIPIIKHSLTANSPATIHQNTYSTNPFMYYSLIGHCIQASTTFHWQAVVWFWYCILQRCRLCHNACCATFKVLSQAVLYKYVHGTLYTCTVYKYKFTVQFSSPELTWRW